MKNMPTKSFRFLLICNAVMLCLLSGCGEKRQAERSGKTQVVVWAHEGQPAEKQAMQGICDAFNLAHQDIAIKVEFKQEQGYGDRLNAAAVAGQLPDVVDVDGPYTAQLASSGILLPIDDLISAEMKKDFLPTIIAQGAYRGKLYTLGAFESSIVIYYQKSILAGLGVIPPASVDSAWSWQQFVGVLQAIQKARPDVMPLETFLTWGGEWLTYAFTPLVWSNGGNLLSGNSDKPDNFMNSRECIQALGQWQQLFTQKLADRNAPPGQFRQGKAAMCWGIFNRWPIYVQAGLDFGMTPLPKFKIPSSPSGSWCWGITTGCRNKAAAARVLQWLVSPEHGVVPMCKANGGIPSRESAVSLMPGYAETRGLFIQQLRLSARARPVTPHYGTLTKELSRALEDISRGSDVTESLTAAARKVDMVLKADPNPL